MDELVELEYETCFYCGDRFVRKRGSFQIACHYCITNYLKELRTKEVTISG